MLTLYHFFLSVCSQKVRLCLAEKELPWSGHHVDLMTFENTTPEYLALNPNGVVPTLVHDGRAVTESTIINEYLDDAFPAVPLRPADLVERAAMRRWIKLEDDTGLPSTFTLTLQKLIKPQMRLRSEAELEAMEQAHPDKASARLHRQVAHEDLPNEDLAAAEARLEGVMDRMERQLRKTPWLAGERYSLADLTWLPFLDRLELLGLQPMIEAARRPAVADWLVRSRARPSYQTAIVDYLQPPSP